MDSRQETIRDITVRWEEDGEGHPVVLLHGVPTSPRLWRHVVPAVSEARLLAWEMPGYGASIDEGEGRDLSVARQAEYLADWMRVLGLDDPILVGHGLGGGIAQIAAVRHSEQVGGLVLVNSISYDSWPIPAVRLMRTVGPLVEQLSDPIFEYAFKAFLRRGHDKRARAEESIAEHWPFYENASSGAAAFVRQVRALDVRDTVEIADQLPGLGLPARIVWGAADPFQDIGYGYRLAYELKAPLDRIERGLHFVPEDHPGRVARAINELLSGEIGV